MPFAPNDMFPEVNNGGGQGGEPGCTRILITAENEDVREKAKLYAENFMMGPNKALKIKQEKEDVEEENKVKVFTFENHKKMNEFAVEDE